MGTSRKILLTTRRSFLIALAGASLGAILLGLPALLAELNVLSLPRLEPLFAAPAGAVTMLFVAIGGSIGALVASLLVNRPYRYKGIKLHGHQWLSWGLVVVIAALVVTSIGYIWLLSAAYGPGTDQQSRIGYTFKNVQRVAGDSPEEASTSIVGMFDNEPLEVPADPLIAAVLAPVASQQNRSLLYGSGADVTLEEAVERSLDELEGPVAVLVPIDGPAYALPAAYAAAQFRVPLLPIDANGTVPGGGGDALEGRTLLVAAPPRLVPDQAVSDLGNATRVADDDVYRHALLWAQYRFEDFGWGMEDLGHNDAYFNFVLTNPNDPGLAAAGLPMAYLGNYGPLLYTEADDLTDLVDMYFWRISPDFYASSSDGPFMNVRVIGGPEDVSYNAQARADLALETHEYKNQVAGASALALVGMVWVLIGVVGATWATLLLPKLVPEMGLYPTLYWPLAILVLGPLGLAALFAAYHHRTVRVDDDGSYTVQRPPWSQGVSATIMGIGVGMPLMVSSMYLFQLNGLPRVDALFWLGSPMDGMMWFIMVVPAIVISILLYMGPMKASMSKQGYTWGVRKAVLPVVVSMLSASAGMFGFTWYLMNFFDLMASEDIWLWAAPIWAGVAVGYFTAFIPNYIMARVGTKPGGT